VGGKGLEAQDAGSGGAADRLDVSIPGGEEAPVHRPSLLVLGTIVWLGLTAVNGSAEPIRWRCCPGVPMPAPDKFPVRSESGPLDALAADLYLFGSADAQSVWLSHPCYVLEHLLADDAWYDGGLPSFPGLGNGTILKLPQTPPPAAAWPR
jgi:hypothetical protein